METTQLAGVIPVHKPTGLTSSAVSRVISKKFGKLKLGHVGTLDPDADGVLPILVGHATKLQDYLLDLPKVYSFEFQLGFATDTLDASGTMIKEAPWKHVTLEALNATVTNFLGPINQTPPIFSAVKFQGKELYKYARSGASLKDLPMESLSRIVHIYSLRVDSFDPPRIRMTTECGKGTYIRTLAFDVAEALGSTAHVIKLTRQKSAGFSLKDCVTIEQIQEKSSEIIDLLVPFDALAIGLPTWNLDDMLLVKRLLDGQTVEVSEKDHRLPVLDRTAEILLRSAGRSMGVIRATVLAEGRLRLHLKRGFQCHQAP
jgi:tRNA pseudouridine55 synthase